MGSSCLFSFAEASRIYLFDEHDCDKDDLHYHFLTLFCDTPPSSHSVQCYDVEH